MRRYIIVDTKKYEPRYRVIPNSRREAARFGGAISKVLPCARAMAICFELNRGVAFAKACKFPR